MRNNLLTGSLRSRIFVFALCAGLIAMCSVAGLRSAFATAKAGREIRRDLDEAAASHQSAVSEALWNYDLNLIGALVDGMVSGPNISYAAVYDQDAVIAEHGEKRAADEYTLQIPITHESRGAMQKVGKLLIQGNLDVLKQKSRSWLLEDLPLFAVGISVSSVLLTLYFTRTVTRRLFDDAAALAAYEQTGTQLPFPQGSIPAKDEIALLETKFNESILALRASAADKEVLLRELYHRTKNNMQTIISLLSLNAGRSHDAETQAMLADMETKVYAMSVVHQMIYEKQNLSRISLPDYIGQIVTYQTEGKRLRERGIKIELDLCAAEVTVDFAVPFGLIVSELLANSLRHAFPAGKKGRIALTLEREADGELAFTIADDGVGSEKDLNTHALATLGLDLVKGLAKGQLGGKLAFKTGLDHGFQCTFHAKDENYQSRI